jgi:hypothetical protein
VIGAALVAASAAAGCRDAGDAGDAVTSCAGACIADPAPHCLSPGDASSPRCPGGLIHAPALGTACKGPDAAQIDACRWRPPPLAPIDALALIDGFAVLPMEMHVAPLPAPSFVWTPPPSAAFVACALFTCQPEIDRGDPDDLASSVIGPSRIANAGACVLALEATAASPASLPIGDQALPIGDACRPEHSFDRVIAFLAAGCWAYDATAIIAASRLVPLQPADLGDAEPAVPDRADCSRDGDTCYDASGLHPFFGACLGGTCQPRCATADDCDVAAVHLLGQPVADTCRWRCREMPTSRAGVCEPLRS